MEENVREIKNNANSFTILVIAIIAILVTAIMSPRIGGKFEDLDVSLWNSLPIGLSLFAALLSLLTLLSKMKPWTAIAIVTAVATVVAVTVGILG